MKLECEKTKLEYVLQKTSRISGKHLTLPVLSCLYLDLKKDNRLVIKSTNLDIGVEMELKVKTITPGVVAVPAQILSNVISLIKDNNITLELIDSNLKIISGKNSVVIKCMPSDDFPSIPKLSSEKIIKIKSQDLINGFKSVYYSASNSNIKPELSSVYIYKSENNLFFVSTDSFRLAEKIVIIKSDIDFPQTLIPNKNISEIIKLLDDYKDEIEIIFDKNQAAFITKDMYIISRLIDGTFPDYKQIIPKSFSSTSTILKEDLINSIKKSNIFSDSLNQVKLKTDLESNALLIESKNNDVGEYKESIKSTIDGESLELNFNNKYITDCFQSINGESLVLSFGGIGKPLMIKGQSDKSFTYIVMPMNK